MFFSNGMFLFKENHGIFYFIDANVSLIICNIVNNTNKSKYYLVASIFENSIANGLTRVISRLWGFVDLSRFSFVEEDGML